MKNLKSVADGSYAGGNLFSRRRWITGLVLSPWLVPMAGAASGRHLQAVLVLASDKQAPQDPSLGSLVTILQRMLPFAHYERLGSARSAVQVPGKATMKLGSGSVLAVGLEAAGGEQVRASVRWSQGGKGVINTTVVLTPGTPAVLGGADYQGGKLVVALTVR